MIRPEEVYTHCPTCGNAYSGGFDIIDYSLTCQSCSFVFYVTPAPSNALILENEKNEILMVKRKFDPKKGYWDFPGGFIKPGEDFVSSTQREIKEELGISIDAIELCYAFGDTYEFQGIDVPVLCLYGRGKIVGDSINFGDDVAGYQFFSKEHARTIEMAFLSHQRALSEYLAWSS